MKTLKLNEVLRVGPQAGINALIRKRREWEKKGEGRGKRRGGDRRGEEKGGKGFHVLLFAFGKARHLSVHQKNKLLSNIGPASTLLLYFPTHRILNCNCGIVVIASQVD